MNGGPVTLALAKGRLLQEVLDLLRAAGFPVDVVEGDRRLLVDVPEAGLRYLLARPGDVVTYVREGAADLGITGKDVLLESPEGFYELVDLRVGVCRLAVAGPPPPPADWTDYLARRGDRLRVAAKLPAVARHYFAELGVRPRVIPLSGAVELAPLVGLADVILDLVATGRTLRENGLCEYVTVAPVTARLIANPVSFRLKDGALTARAEALRAAAARLPMPAAVPVAPAGGGEGLAAVDGGGLASPDG